MVDKPQFDALRRPAAPGLQQPQAQADDKTVITDVEKILADAVDALHVNDNGFDGYLVATKLIT